MILNPSKHRGSPHQPVLTLEMTEKEIWQHFKPVALPQKTIAILPQVYIISFQFS